MTDTGYAEILALRRRLARLEEMAKAAAQPADNPATFGDALDTLRRTGSARGPAIDALRAAVEGPGTPAPAPGRDQLAEAARVLTAELRGAPTIEGAFADMKARASRLNAIESGDPGASGRVDPSAPALSAAAERLDRILKGR